MKVPGFEEVKVNGGKAYIRVDDVSYIGHKSENQSFAVVGGAMLVIHESVDDLVTKIKSPKT